MKYTDDWQATYQIDMEYKIMAESKIPGFKMGGSWRFHKNKMDRWISEQERKETKGKINE